MIRNSALKPPSAKALLAWYDKHARPMPWRVRGGRPNPYHELLSEFMLQQTQVATVIPYFYKFIKRWPTLKRLAKARLDDVRAAWAGLGYYRRAKFLHECAREIVAKHNGVIPQDEETLRLLPGIGAYTAAAIAAIAFDKKAVVVDGNVERVMARVFAMDTPLPKAKKIIHARVEAILPKTRYGDFAQGMMELGATLCTPKNPDCSACPWKKNCNAFVRGEVDKYPRKIIKAKIPQKYATVFVLMNAKSAVLVTRRAESGLFAGMWEFPSTPWEAKKPSAAVEKSYAPAPIRWQTIKTPVSHVFSHFKLEMALRIGHSRAAISWQSKDGCEYHWMKWKDLSKIALPTLMHKVARLAQQQIDEKQTKRTRITMKRDD